jgi:hypothetical protein
MLFTILLCNGIVCYDKYNIINNNKDYNFSLLILNIIISIIYFSIFVIYLIINFNNLEIEILIYNLHFLIQFLVSNYIFRSNNIYNFYKKYNNKYWNLVILIPIINFILIISEIIYSDNYNNYIILIFLNNFLGLNNLMFNIINFIIVFTVHLFNLYNCFSKLKNLIENNINRGYLEIIKEIINLKYDICSSISNLHYIFNYYTLINIISIILIFSDNSIDNYINYIIIIKSCIIELICLGIIISISEYRGDLSTLIYNPLFAEKFLKKINLETLNEITNNDISVDIENNLIDIDNYKLMINMLNDNFNYLEWIVIKEVIGNKWVDFSLFGIKLHNLDSITKIILIITFIYTII